MHERRAAPTGSGTPGHEREGDDPGNSKRDVGRRRRGFYGFSHTVLGRYVLLEVIGQGGMGVVWEAFYTVLDRRIALKLLIPRIETTESVVVEARALARAQHPNVVIVHDAGVYDADGSKLAYVAMSAGAIELAESSCKALDQNEWESDHTACLAWLAAHNTK